MNDEVAPNKLTEKLEKMSKAELVTYANLTYGLNVNSNHGKDDLINAVTRAATKYAGNAQVSLDVSSLKPGHARIKINKTELNKQGRPVIVGLNGKMCSLPVGAEIVVPNALVEILNHATRYEYEVDPAQGNELVRREVQSYPFSVLEMAPSA